MRWRATQLALLLFALNLPAQTQRIVELPPYVVEDSLVPPWRYAKIPGLEVISRCSDAATTDLIETNYQLLGLLDELLLPRKLQPKLDVPTAYVLYDEDTQPAVSREFIAEFQRHEQQSPAKGTPSIRIPTSVRVLPNYRFSDSDSLTVFFLLEVADDTKGGLTLTPGYLRYLLTTRVPALPPWFVEGMQELYKTVDLGNVDLGSAFHPSQSRLFSIRSSDAGVTMRPAFWVSDEETAVIRNGRIAPADLLVPAPAVLFTAPPPEPGHEADFHRWLSHAALFIRWALDDTTQSHRQALWKFVERASVQSATEALFLECFGLKYADLDLQLRAYLRGAVKDAIYLRPAGPSPNPVVKLRDATEGEVSRLKGGLNRLEIAYVQALIPDLKERYVAQARRTLRRAYDHGDRDPRLLAELGLFECNAGNDTGARPFLAAAVQAEVVRPQAYYELARIDFHSLRSAAASAKLTPPQATALTDLLLAARRQSPPLPQAYELFTLVWLSSEQALTPGSLEIIDEGLRLFPHRTGLLYLDAMLMAQYGFTAEARTLIKRGLQLTSDAKVRTRFLRLSDALLTRPQSEPPPVPVPASSSASHPHAAL